jgi:anti-sigma regulatory factor (Ser/Thr protein kinase)
MTGPTELTFGVEPDVVPRARRLVRSALSSADPELAEDAELVVSELTTNAALHGTPPVTVRLRVGSGVRIEVEDAGRHLPVVLPSELDATTGRGLSLIAAVATRWGVERLSGGGKQVWAELEAGSRRTPAPITDAEALLERWGEDDVPLYTVRLGEVPTDLLLQAEAHIDGVVRSAGYRCPRS